MMTVSPGAEAAMPSPQKKEDSALTPKLAAPQHKPRPLPLFLELLRSETAANPERMARALEGLRRYQEAGRDGPPEPMPAIASAYGATLRDYGSRGRPVLFVPSLINPPSVLDLSEETSLLRWLATQGFRPLLIDWGWNVERRRSLSVAGHVEEIILPFIDAIGERPALVGYCLGGTMSLAAAARRDVASVITIAAPWCFSGFPEAARRHLANLWRDSTPAVEAMGLLPMEVLQSAFWSLDPARTVGKFEAFAEMPPASAAARTFVRLEDWANDGPPLPEAAARELFEGFVETDAPGRGEWEVGGVSIEPGALRCPSLNIVSTTDRIVPAGSAVQTGERIELALGHVGMMVGGRAKAELWEPLAAWLSRSARCAATSFEETHMTEVVITAAKRTPVGSFLGAFAATPAHELGRVAIEAALAQAGVAPEEVSEVILGQVLTAAQGQNPARQASMAAGVPKEIPAWGLNQVCGSGLRAVAVAAQSIMARDADIVVAGGQESMSLSAHAQNIRGGQKMGGLELIDTMIKDGLTDVFNGYHMGITAENLAEQYQIARSDQDEFACASQNKAEKARREGRFDAEIAPVTIKSRKGETVVDRDEFIREGVEVASLAGLRAAFKKEGTVTAGNASGLNDGAAALVLMSREEAEKRGAPILARIKSFASAGVDPSIMGIGPVPSTRRALEKAGWTIADLDLIEANEAFAAQALAVGKELGWETDRVNVNGGAISIGHPIGASGARVLTTLLYEMGRRDAKKGLATLCIGGGMGIAMCVERD